MSIAEAINFDALCVFSTVWKTPLAPGPIHTPVIGNGYSARVGQVDAIRIVWIYANVFWLGDVPAGHDPPAFASVSCPNRSIHGRGVEGIVVAGIEGDREDAGIVDPDVNPLTVGLSTCSPLVVVIFDPIT